MLWLQGVNSEYRRTKQRDVAGRPWATRLGKWWGEAGRTMILRQLKTRELSTDSKRLVSNFLSLSVLQGLNYLFPLITLPYVLQVIGPEKYGAVGVAFAFFTHLQLFIDYGFNLSATKDVSIHRDDIQKVSEIYSSVMTIKIGLLLVSVVPVYFLVTWIPMFNPHRFFYFISFLGLVGNVFFPIWLLQGLERMKYITYFTFATRLFTTVLIFITVRSQQDYIYLALLNSAAAITAGFASLWLVFYKFGLQFRVPSHKSLKQNISTGWHVFISTFCTNVYINSNVLILRMFTNDLTVGYYSAAEKVVTVERGFANIIFQCTYPYICKKSVESRAQLIRFYRNVFAPLLACFCVGGLVLFLFAEPIMLFLSGESLGPSVTVLKMLSFVPFIVAVNIPAYQSLLAYNMRRSYTVVLVSGSVLNIFLNVMLTYKFSYIGTALSVLLTELYITTGLYLILEVRHKKYSLFRAENSSVQ